ncbi:MarR family winged helix-turn-helix transcriptional regulator [Terriglobus saanensis]|uniref:Regulatory protein MarR n=1 Tax=Terriglobus saanensis (strain ATCC BAA-1853 / DSM 23119 / SP1PR4) TaxID=401053 RepID=E8V7Y8_TERSS|nr:MarR family winged helix-turn-helix transcriptional regulator [Terriglobus saanensis]ADV82912.1 regulatory protein MarR [Terriglobus saanensis SP1PR4]
MKPNPGDPGCTCYRLRQSARIVSRTYDTFLAPCGISIGQFGLLITLSAMKGESISSLAEVLQMDRTTLTRNLIPLQKLGYISVEQASDKRARSLSLTVTGQKTLTVARPKWKAAQRSLEKKVGKAEVNLLNVTLENTLLHLQK